MSTQAKVYSIKLTDLNKETICILVKTENLDFAQQQFHSLVQNQIELTSCNYLADISEEKEGVVEIIEAIGITKITYLEAIARFKNVKQDGMIS